MTAATKVFLADLAHTYSVDTKDLLMPLNIGFIKAYAVKEHGSSVDIVLFKHPEKLLARIAKERPEIIGFSNYGWNENLNLNIGKYVRTALPESLIIAGGPNIPTESDDQLAYFMRHDYVDFLIVDGGEEPFSGMIGWWRENRGNFSQLPNNLIWRDGNTICKTDAQSLTKNIDFIPSPYLGGHLDEFLSAGLNPMIETNRGCPFLCTFCSWGAASKNQVLQLELNTILKEIDYISERSSASRWLVCDANFAMFPRDVEIAKAIRRAKDKNKYPKTCYMEMAKGVTPRNAEITEILGDMVQPNMALQSMDEQVLENIKRTNIPVATYMEHRQKLKNLSADTVTELIVPLPGETLESHKTALNKIFNMGVDIVINHNLRFLEGAEANSKETRKNYGFKTRYRLIHGDAGIYRAPDGTEVRTFECEESLRETSTMNEKEMFYLRKLHFLVECFWNLDVYKPLLKAVRRYGVSVVEILDRFLDLAKNPDPSLGQTGKKITEFFTYFDKRSHSEWFNSQEEIETYFLEENNFKRLINHEYEKLNVLFSVILLKDYKQTFDLAIRHVLTSYNNIPESILDDVANYTFALFPAFETQVKSPEVNLPENFLELLKESKEKYVPSSRQKRIRFEESPQRLEMLKVISDARDKTLSKALTARGLGSVALRDLRLIDTISST